MPDYFRVKTFLHCISLECYGLVIGWIGFLVYLLLSVILIIVGIISFAFLSNFAVMMSEKLVFPLKNNTNTQVIFILRITLGSGSWSCSNCLVDGSVDHADSNLLPFDLHVQAFHQRNPRGKSW
jgi:hypothetical protein